MGPKFDVVISGISGRYPECDDILTFKKKLYESENFITSTEQKWSSKYKFKLGEYPIPIATGKFTNVEDYDPMVFKMSGIVGRSSDIVNRKVLEPSFEAIIDAGINPYSLGGENVGVFMSCGINEFDNRVQDPGRDVLGVIGCSKTMLSNRISFAYDLIGPSVTYHCDPLGSAKALEKAYNDIADGYVSAAIVGACSNLLIPTLSLVYSAFGFVSPDGLCRAFDQEANGYGRSESCVLLFLQKSEDAKRIYGTVKLCDIIYKSINPSNFVKYEEDFVKGAFEKMYDGNKRCRPSDVCFIEMNANGFKQLDKIESNVVADIFCQNRNDPLLVGSIKSNLGHTEGTAFYMSLVKGLLALETGVIAPNLNFNKPNEEIRALRDGKLKVVDQLTPLPGDTIAINTFGLVEGVEHVVIQQNPTKPADDASQDEETLPQLLLICGRTKEHLTAAIEKLQQVQMNKHFVSMFNDAFVLNMPSHIYRGYRLTSKSADPISYVDMRGERNRPIWFLYSGMGSQWNCMGLGLLDIPIFADVVKKCDAVLKPRGIDIYRILTSDDPTIFDDIINAFVGIITIQIALTEILKLLGFQPDGIIGHSVGENGCAYADGCLTLEQAVLASYARGVASTEVQTTKGMMAAVGKGYNQIKDSLPERVEVACHNSAENCTLTGPADDVNEFVELLKNDGVFAKAVNVANIAYHSKYIAPAGKGLLTRLSEVIPEPKERSSRWISTSMPKSEWNKPLAKHCSAEYLTNNLLSPVLFEEGCKHIPKNALVIEIAPHGLLQTILKRSLPETCTNISLTLRSKNKENLKYLFTSIGKLYIAGCEPDINALYPKVTYPAPRNTPPISPYATWEHEVKKVSERFTKAERPKPLSGELIQIRINDDAEYYYLRFHRISNRIIIPPSFFLYLTWWMLALSRDEKLETLSVVFQDIKMHKNVSLSLKKPRFVSIMIQTSNQFEVILEDENKPDKLVIVMSGKIAAAEHDDVGVGINEYVPQKPKFRISSSEFYNYWHRTGYGLTDLFVNLQEITCNETDYHSIITWNENWVAFLDSLMKFYMFSCTKDKSKLIYPAAIKKLRISPTEFMRASTGADILCHLDVCEKLVHCKGIEMKDIEFERFPKAIRNDRTAVQLEGLQFIPHSSPCCQNVEEFFKFCLQMIVDNCTPTHKESKVIVVEKIHEYRKSLQKIIKENLQFQSKIISYSAKEVPNDSIKNHQCIFVISENNVNCAEFKCENEFLLLVSAKNDAINLDIKESYLEISKQSFSNMVFGFLKKKPISNGHPAPVFVECENLSFLPDSKLFEKENDIVVIRRNIESNDLPVILGNSKNTRRFLYWLGNEMKPLKSMEKLFKKQLDMNFRVNIFKNGEFGSYRNICGSLSDGWNDKGLDGDDLSPTDILIESVDVKYYHSDVVVENVQSENYVCGIEYAGIERSGKRIMGLAKLNRLEPLAPADPYLTWPIPKNWSLEDAATAPFLLTQTRRIMDIITDQGGRTADSLLINRGKEKRLGNALISLALAQNCSVFVTVSNQNEAKNIKSKFPKLKESQILNEEKCMYEMQLRSITKNGVEVVVNCLPGVEHITASLNCLSEFGRYIEVGDQNIRDIQLGLYSFLKSITFNVVPNTIVSILNLRDEEKKRLKINVDEEIKNNGPLLKYQNSYGSEAKNLAHNVPDSTTTKHLRQISRFDRHHSYIIIAGDKKCNNWCELVEWLITKGVRKFIVAVHNFGAVSKYSHQMNRWLSQPDVSIILSSAQKIDSLEKVNELVANAEKQAPLGAVFFMSMESASIKIRYMDLAVQLVNPNVPFISLFSGGIKECEDRKFRGSPSVVLHAENTEKLSLVLPHLEDVLFRQDNNNSPTLFRIVDRNPLLDTESADVLLRDYLPKEMQILELIGEGVTEIVEFEEVTSLCSRYDETRGVYPIFVLPALHTSLLQPLISKLLHPVFSCTLHESTRSITKMAEDLLKAVSRIQPTGPITLIGETWNSTLTIELLSLLEREKRKYKLFLLEGNPKDWSERLKRVVLTPKFENNLIKHIFRFTQISPDTTVSNGLSFEDSVKNYLSKLPRGSVNNADNVTKTIKIIRDRLIMAAHYKYPNNILNNVTLFTRHSIDENELKLSITSDVFSLPESTYENFIRDSRISKIINEKAMHDWWEYSVH